MLSNIVVRKSRKLGGVNLDFDFDVTKDGKLFIIMDPSIEDRIECNGQGRIAFKMTPETDMDIKGSYEIFQVLTSLLIRTLFKDYFISIKEEL